MAKWFRAHYNQVRITLAVKSKKSPQVLTSLLNQWREISIIIVIIIVIFIIIRALLKNICLYPVPS